MDSERVVIQRFFGSVRGEEGLALAEGGGRAKRTGRYDIRLAFVVSGCWQHRLLYFVLLFSSRRVFFICHYVFGCGRPRDTLSDGKRNKNNNMKPRPCRRGSSAMTVC